MINITFTSDPLPLDFKGTLEDFRERFITNLRGSIRDTEVLTGQVNGGKPSTNVGPWFNIDSWYMWNGSEYVPNAVKVGGAGYVVQLSNQFVSGSTIPADKTQSLQDKEGVVALMSDLYEGRPTVVLTGPEPVLDCNLGLNFSQILTANTHYKLVNMRDGQEVALIVNNSPTPYAITWEGIFWTTGTAPLPSGPDKSDLYILKNIGGSVLGRQYAGYV